MEERFVRILCKLWLLNNHLVIQDKLIHQLNKDHIIYQVLLDLELSNLLDLLNQLLDIVEVDDHYS